MALARPAPYPLRDFTQPTPQFPPIAASPADAVAAARLEGFEQGFAAAKAIAEAETSRAVIAVADALAEERARFAEGLAAEAQSLRETARTFLTDIAGRFAQTHEAAFALVLVDRLLSACAERVPARLEISPRSYGALAERIAAEISERGASDFVDLAPAADLAPGDCRLVWRGGAASRRLVDVLTQLDAAFVHAHSNSTETST